MSLKNCPFTLYNGKIYRPILPVKIINPHTKKHYRTYGLIDTGADECAIPASYAVLLGHNLQAGQIKRIRTGNGETVAYSHTTKFEIYHPISSKLEYEMEDTPVDFLPNLHIVLLGAKSFLSRFILEVDYPGRVFSLNIS